MGTANRILFVDDEAKVLSGLRRTLRKKAGDWDMSFTNSGEEALAAFDADPFAFVVTDLAMPGLTGLQVAHEIKQRAPQCQCIILTGTADLQIAIAAINESDIFRFFTKPCPPDRLIGGIEDGLAQYQKATATDRGRTTQEPRADFGMAALNRLPMGVIIVDRNARIVSMNARGAEIITQGDGLVAGSKGDCRTASVEETKALHATIRAAIDAEPGEEPHGAVSIARPSMNRSLAVLVSAIPAPADDGSHDAGGAAILFVTDPERQPTASAEVLSRMFQITGAEAKLVQALVRGLRVDEAAAEIGITTSTARTYLKQIFSKTGTGRQAELVQLVLTSPALIGIQKNANA